MTVAEYIELLKTLPQDVAIGFLNEELEFNELQKPRFDEEYQAVILSE